MWGQVKRSDALVTQNPLSKPEDLMLQNAALLKKSAPWPPNISDEHVLDRACHAKSIFAHLPRFVKLFQNLHVLLTFVKVQNPLHTTPIIPFACP